LISAEVFPQIEMPKFLRFCLLLAATVDLDSRYEQVYSALLNDKTMCRPTLSLAADLFSFIEPIENNTLPATVHDPAFGLLFKPFEEKPERSVLAKGLALNPTALLAFCGTKADGAELPEHCTVYLAAKETEPLIAHEAEYRQVLALLKNANPPERDLLIVRLHGAAGAGKRFILRKAADELKKNLLFTDCKALFKEPPDVLRLKQIAAWCLLRNAYLCLDNFEPTAENNSAIIETLRTLGVYLPPVIVCGTNNEVFALPDGCVCHSVEIGATDIDEQRKFWEHFSEQGGYEFSSDTGIERFVMATDLTAGVIEGVLKLAQTEAAAASRRAITPRDIETAIREKTRTNLSNLAVAVKTVFTWDDLILSDDAVRMLKKVCARVRHERKVNQEWGLGAKLPYGRGVSLLLYGAPGTGKTMAAQVLANELGRDLYKIELSRMVSKYIGETEKNLGMIFDSAKGCNAILFFDEADALFSKRSEVKDAQDKYANTETSYLLQRLEEHNGVSILATNNTSNIDTAFKRRITYFINIELPNEKTRLRIWESLRIGKLPISDKIDFEQFAKRYDITGSEIKSALTEAAYMAAEQDSEITRELLLSAIQDEYRKSGRSVMKADFI
jgi:AAA+ superfamily predicted ATPase